MPSKVAIDPEEPSLGRIRADSVPPPHSAASIKRCISRVERNPELANAALFADISCKTPLKEGHIPILRTDCPGLSPDKPMAIVQNVQMPIKIPDGRYFIKNRKADVCWSTTIKNVYFLNFILGEQIWLQVNIHLSSIEMYNGLQWNITNDTNGNIFMTSSNAPWKWVGADLTWSMAPVPWRLIPVDGKSYYY